MAAAQSDTVWRVRRGVAALVLPAPQAVPGGAVLGADGEHGALRTIVGRPLEAAGFIAWPDVHAVRQVLAQLPSPACSADQLAALDVARAADAHDAYFRVARTQEPAGLAYLRGLLQAMDIFLDEARDTEGGDDAAEIAAALLELWHGALGQPIPAPALPAAGVAATEPAASRVDPLRRWLRGHQVFAALTQGLIWTLRGFEAAAAQGRHDDERSALARMARLYGASAAAFRFTADFDAVHYTELIRPSMTEPQAPSGFSGTMSSDHGHLVGLLGALRDPLARAAERFPQEHATLKQALARLYDDHQRVCERFAGEHAPSLRSGRQCGQPSGSEMLERFKARRLAMLA